MKAGKPNLVIVLAGLAVLLLLFGIRLRNEALQSRKDFEQTSAWAAARAARPELPRPTKEEGEAALARMRVEEDKVEGFKRYIARTTPADTRTRSGIYLAFIEKPEIVGAQMQVTYTGESWIFFRSLVSNCDGARYEFDFDPQTHVGVAGRVYEWANVLIVERKYFEFLHACAKAKEATIRLRGKFTYDHTMSAKEKQAILDTLSAFQARGGSFDLP